MVMIEAVYLVVIAILVIFFSINVGVIYYNRIVLTSVANEAANAVAEVYGCEGKEPFYAFTASDHFIGRDIYRHFPGLKGFDLKNATEKKGKWYTSYLVHHSEFVAEKNMDFSDVTVSCEENNIGLQMVTVSIKREYPVFILNPASFFDLGLKYEVSANGNAVCYDIIHQINLMSLEKEIENKIDELPVLNQIDKFIEAFSK